MARTCNADEPSPSGQGYPLDRRICTAQRLLDATRSEILCREARGAADNLNFVIFTDWLPEEIVFAEHMPELCPITEVSDAEEEMWRLRSENILVHQGLADAMSMIVRSAVESQGTCQSCDRTLAQGWCENCSREPASGACKPDQPIGYIGPMLDGPLAHMIQRHHDDASEIAGHRRW